MHVYFDLNENEIYFYLKIINKNKNLGSYVRLSRYIYT